MGYFKSLDLALTQDGVRTPVRRRPVAFATRTVRCYRRAGDQGGPVCDPCSDSEDRATPITLRGDALCCVCRQRLDDRSTR